MKKFLSLLSSIAIAFLCNTAHATTIEQDVITADLLPATGTNYVDFSNKTFTSGVVYAGQSAKNNGISLRGTSPSGIVSTESLGKVRTVVVKWNSKTNSGRKLDIYGKDTPYTSAADLYSTSTRGTKIGTITKGTNTTLEISADYQYVGLRSNSNAMYLDEITISWEFPWDIAKPVISLSREEPFFVGDDIKATISCSTEDTEIYYTTNGNDPMTSGTKYDGEFSINSSETGVVTIKAVAKKGEEVSNVITKNIEINPVVNTLAEFLEFEDGKIVRLNNNVTVTCASMQNIYIKDATGCARLHYANNYFDTETYKKGVVLAGGLVGTKSDKGQMNITTATPAMTGELVTVEPEVIAFSALANDANLYRYVKVKAKAYKNNSNWYLGAEKESGGVYISDQTIGTELLSDKTYDFYGTLYLFNGTIYDFDMFGCEESSVAFVAPTISLESETYDNVNDVTITAVEGDYILYTTDDNDILSNFDGTLVKSNKVTITIDKSCTLRAIATDESKNIGDEASATYIMKTAAPTIEMDNETKIVTISTKYNEGVTIHYTTDGTPASIESPVYTNPFEIAIETTVSAVAQYGEFDLSDVVTFEYTNAKIVTVDANIISDFGTPNNGDEIGLFKKGPITVTCNGVRWYSTDNTLRIYKDNTINLTADNAIIKKVEFVTDGKLTNVTVTPGTYTDNSWTNINSSNATLKNNGNVARIKSFKIYYLEWKEADNALAINEKGSLYKVNFVLQGIKVNDGVLYACTTEESAAPSIPNKSGFDNYEDRDWEQFDQRDWVAIDGAGSDYEGSEISTGFIANYDGNKLIPVNNLATNGEAASYELNTYRPRNIIYGNYENIPEDDYKAFYVKAKVNEVANFEGLISADGYLYGDSDNDKINGQGIKIVGIVPAVSTSKNRVFEGILVNDANYNHGVKIIATGEAHDATGVESLNADRKATIYGTEGAVIVIGAEGNVDVFDAMGRMLKSEKSNGSATVEMPAGYYIVRTAGTAKAVIVK